VTQNAENAIRSLRYFMPSSYHGALTETAATTCRVFCRLPLHHPTYERKKEARA